MEFLDLLVKRRAIRDYEKREIPLEIIHEVIRDACLAPSSGNGQPWRYIIVNHREWIRRLSDESKKNLLATMGAAPDHPLKKYEAALGNRDFNVFYNAPCLIFIACSKEIKSGYVDCALAACYLMFSAAEHGLGTCWVDLGSDIRDPGLKSAIGLPDDHRIIAPIIMGYPKSIPPAPIRNKPQILKTIS